MIKTYWDVLYYEKKLFKETENKKYKNLCNAGIAPQHNLRQKSNNKGHSCVFLHKKSSGSITVEASFCVPIFFIALFSLFYVLKCIYLIDYTEDVLTDCARDYAVMGKGVSMGLALAEDGVFVRYDEESNPPICYVSYNVKIPFISSKLLKLSFYQQTAISDYSGRSMAGTGNGDKDDEEEYVYVAETGRVYHCDMGCTYLKPSVKSISGNSVSSKRNSSGGKYKACERCCRNENAEDMSTVYITTYGDRYHKYKDCSGIKRNARRVKKSEVGELPPCSKCGKDND